MKWKQVQSIIEFVAALLTIITVVGGLVSKCSSRQEVAIPAEQNEPALESVCSDPNVPTVTTGNGVRLSFKQKWEERKIHFRESEEKGEWAMFKFFISYFPGLNILFLLLLLGWALLDVLWKKSEPDLEALFIGFSYAVVVFVPLFWVVIYLL